MQTKIYNLVSEYLFLLSCLKLLKIKNGEIS